MIKNVRYAVAPQTASAVSYKSCPAARSDKRAAILP